MNQTDKVFTVPQKLLKSSSEPAIKQLLGFEKYLDNKITNKGNDVKVFAHKQNLINNMPTMTNDDISYENNYQNTNRVEKQFNESKMLKQHSLSKIKSNDIDLGAPSRRKDAEKLNEWLDFMLEKYINNPEMAKFSDDFRIKASQLI
jgi:hypothetical protein